MRIRHYLELLADFDRKSALLRGFYARPRWSWASRLGLAADIGHKALCPMSASPAVHMIKWRRSIHIAKDPLVVEPEHIALLQVAMANCVRVKFAQAVSKTFSGVLDILESDASNAFLGVLRRIERLLSIHFRAIAIPSMG